jgi:hypothetical protein
MKAGDLLMVTSWTPVEDVDDARKRIGEAQKGDIVLMLGKSENDSWYVRAQHPRIGLCQIFNSKLVPCK